MLPSIKDYTIRELIAEGKHTMIFRAQRKIDNQSVIIKLLKTESIIPKNVEHLTHEFNMMSKLHSPHVVKAFELVPIQNSLILVMEDFNGKTLSELLEEGEWDLLLSLETAINIASAIGDIHHQHIIHKDIKPQNILVNLATKETKIIDFGISTQLSRELQQTLNPEQMEGSIPYMSPEQTGRMNRPVDYRSDIYSLGVTLYQLFAKRLPFDAESPLELIHLHIAQQPQPPSDVNHALPAMLSDIILKCMSKEAEHRYHSAFGLRYDLERCRDSLIKTSAIPHFQIGERDVYDHFNFPEKLYGRNKEINVIKKCVNDVWGGNTLLLTLSGYPGIGKSSLVLEAQKEISTKGGRFAQAKFDQFKHNVPYFGLIKAYQSIIQQLLGETDEILQNWKNRILEAVGDSGKVLTEVIPEIELIIGPQPDIEKLTPMENANRFNYVMINFLKALLQPDNPIVFFIDDFQWADEPSLKIIEHFYSDPTVKNFILIVAYRENEVSPFHPVTMTFKNIAASGGKVVNMPIHPLTIESLQALIQDTFYGPPKQTEDLAQHLYKKTKGNPFFALQLLKLFYEQELIYFDKHLGCWSAKIDAIASSQVSDNVADLVIAKLKSIPENVLNILKIGATVENRFDLDLLSQVSELPREQIIQDLNAAQQEDLILEERTQISFLSGKIEGKTQNRFYRFLHDRIQQATYSLLTNADRSHLHYKIGKAILRMTPPEKLAEKSIDIVNHLNVGETSLLPLKEKDTLIKLNLAAGHKAKDSIAYLAAIQYFRQGIDLLPNNSWQEDYALTMELHENLALCLMITGGITQAEDLFDLCLNKAHTSLEKANIYKDLIFLYSQMQQYGRCFDLAMKAFTLFEFDYNIAPSRLALIKDLIQHKVMMLYRKVEDLESLPVTSDQKVEVICVILASLIYPAFVTGKKTLFLKIALTIVDLSFNYGITKQTSMGLATFAMAMGSEMLKDYPNSSRYGQTAFNLAQLFPKTVEKAGTTYMYYAFIHRWKNPLRSCVLPLRQNFRQLLECGASAVAAANAVYINLISLVSGEKVDNVLISIGESLDEIKKYSSKAEEMSMMVHREVCLALKGLRHDCTDPRPSDLNDELLWASSSNNQYLLFTVRYEVWHMVLLYLFGKYEEAHLIGKKILTQTDNFPNWIEWHIFYFFHSLTLASLLNRPSDNRQHWKQLQENYKKLKRWGNASPVNYSHYALLIEAEITRIQGKKEQIIENFEKAIEAAKKSECTQDIAIAYERFGTYYKSQKLDEMTSIFLHKALQYYTQWGAEAKCLDFKNVYAEHLTLESLSLSSFSIQDMSFLTTTANTKTLISTTASQTGSSMKTESSAKRTDSSDFDVNALIDASQALSKEIVLDKVMESLMHVVIVNASADKVFLILFENKKAKVYSQTFLNQKYTPLITPIPVEEKEDDLCLAVINYVTRTHQELLLNDAVEEGNYRYDPYILHKKPKSILCIPLLQKGTLAGLLYLENNVSKGAFTPKRLRLLSLLSSQMAISIENAQFYAKLEYKVQDRTKELQQRNKELQEALQTIKNVQQQMIQQEKLASLGLLTSGIAHELKNPLNFVINFSQIAKEHLVELFKDWSDAKSLDETRMDDFFAQISECLNKVDFHGKRADNIIENMLNHSYKGSTTAQTIDINSLIDQALNITVQRYNKKDHNFNLLLNKQLDPNLKNISGFQTDLIRVFVNIFDNSCYALLEKKKMGVPDFVPKLDITTEIKNDRAIIKIRDNALGIKPEVIDKVFQPFFTTKPPGSGTGLGLSIAYDIITKQHGGSIEIISEINKFTEFTISLIITEHG